MTNLGLIPEGKKKGKLRKEKKGYLQIKFIANLREKKRKIRVNLQIWHN